MSVTFENLACYVQAERVPLITNLPWGSPTINLISHRTGIKCKEAIGYLGVETEWQDCDCDPEPAGSIELSDRIIEVKCVLIYDTLCDIEFLCTRYETEIRRTAGKESLGSIEEWIINAILLDIAYKLELALWQGDTDSAVSYLSKFNGLLKIAQAAADDPENPGVPTANRITQAEGESDYQFLQRIRTMPAFIQASLRGRMVFFVGLDRFASITAQLEGIRINFIENPNIPGGFRELYVSAQEFTLPGTNYRVIGVPGLTGTNRVVVGSLDNLFWGTDYADDRETINSGINEEKGYWWYRLTFFSGTQIGLINEVIVGTFTSELTAAQNLSVNANVSIVSPLGENGGVLTEAVATAAAGAVAQLMANQTPDMASMVDSVIEKLKAEGYSIERKDDSIDDETTDAESENANEMQSPKKGRKKAAPSSEESADSIDDETVKTE